MKYWPTRQIQAQRPEAGERSPLWHVFAHAMATATNRDHLMQRLRDENASAVRARNEHDYFTHSSMANSLEGMILEEDAKLSTFMAQLGTRAPTEGIIEEGISA